MEIKGDNFIKNVHDQREREELEKMVSEANLKYARKKIEPDDENIQIEEEKPTGFEDIMLEENLENEESFLTNEKKDEKKKYLVLGIILIVLFLATIVIIRLLFDDDKQNDFTIQESTPITQNETKDSSSIDENYKKLINDRINNNEDKSIDKKIEEIKSETNKINQETNNVEKKLNNTAEEIKKEIEPVKKEIITKPIEKKIEEEPVVAKKTVKKTIKNSLGATSALKPKGYFIQIGAFVKQPSAAYIKKIRSNSLNYKIYSANVKGTFYNKVLIGPYSSKSQAKKAKTEILKKLNLSNAYVVHY